MSVTFAIDSVPTGSFTLSPACEQTTEVNPFESVVFASHDEAVAALVAHKAVCADCAAYGCYSQAVMDVEGDLDVNVSNYNAAALIERLGIERNDYHEIVGSLDATAFLGHVLIALGALDTMTADAGIPAVRSGNWVDCGRDEGYFENVLGRLYDLAAEARRLGREVVWS